MIHADLLKLLLPPASVDPNGPSIGAELVADGAALDRALGYAEQALEESDPRTTAALLADWERVYGLPDPVLVAAGISQSFQERRSALVAKVTFQGGQSVAFYLALAATLGYTITITECHPETTEDDTEYPVRDEQYRFVWIVNAALYTVRDLVTEDDTEMATAVWGNALLESFLTRYKPAHTLVLFAYT
ncbi:YmfQ family protein [Accumulibacter sp.]|uniref:YmfQ family protein n=1 Tax=Accumulibacter sp. TaxID=2053492 RepID=UPI0025F7697B|nr:putative phage tail protein [Accumulibacter sp.]MCM8595124.1 DUF2313 domain-containing protein [Accumulibacter sp.]MCM8625510.1 DUF2313 domain-containing protein [Accumulibacter sp.]MDS4049270.1 DUF2313 domain-containing protein [Accumulibacter sp.]